MRSSFGSPGMGGGSWPGSPGLVRSSLLAFLLAAVCTTAAAQGPGAPDVASALPGAMPPGITAFIESAVAGNLFRAGENVALLLRLANSGAAQDVEATLYITSADGMPVKTTAPVRLHVAADGVVEHSVVVPGSDRWPVGPYRVEAAIVGERGLASASAPLGVWSGPADVVNDRFGVSWYGALNSPSTWRDLDLLRSVGVAWLRFPLQGWLPEGGAPAAHTADLSYFIQEAARRGFKLVAAFTPEVTVDRAVNPVQADRDYRDSLLAAAARYGFQVQYWELQQAGATGADPIRSGTSFSQIAQAREALRRFDSRLAVIYSYADPFADNTRALLATNVLARGDVLAMRYNFSGIPENAERYVPPAIALPTVAAALRAKTRRRLPVWVTEYGFDGALGPRLPGAAQQAALSARALILDRAVGIERSFWRHLPGGDFDLPLLADGGGAQPSLLALRTVLERLRGAALASDLSQPGIGLRAYLFSAPDARGRTAYTLAYWCETVPATVSMRTDAMSIPLLDLWGDAVEINPVDKVCLLQADEYPRFASLGSTRNAALSVPFAQLSPSRPVLVTGAQNTLRVAFQHDPRLMPKSFAAELRVRRWPGDEEATTQKVYLDPHARMDLLTVLPVPEGARPGLVYALEIDLVVGSRLMGHMTVPVRYAAPTLTPATP